MWLIAIDWDSGTDGKVDYESIDQSPVSLGSLVKKEEDTNTSDVEQVGREVASC